MRTIGGPAIQKPDKRTSRQAKRQLNLNHRDFLNTLSDKQKQSLTARSDTQGLQQLAIHVGCILLNSLLIVLLPQLLPLFLFTQGILLVFLFTLLHETTHNTPFQSIRLNRLASWFCGFVIFLPAEWFRHFHLAHHRYTHQPDKDPELTSPKPSSKSEYLVYLSGIPVWKSHLGTLLLNARGKCNDRFVPASRISTVTTEARLMIAAYAIIIGSLVLLAPKQLLQLWLIPLLLGQPFLRAYLLAEHAHCDHADDMFRNTRTTLTNRLLYRLAWNMPYHAEHHAFPSVPFYRLPELHELTQQHLQVCEDGYWNFNRRYFSGDTVRDVEP